MKAKKNAFRCMRSKFLLVPSIVFFFVIVGLPISFAEETGSIEIEIRYTNLDRINNYQTVLQVFQDDGDSPYVTIEFPESNPYLIDSLPLGHKYTVEVYVNNMFAETGFHNLEETEGQIKLNIPLQGGYRFIALYNDNETPIEGATVSIKSDDGHQWSQATTDSDGKTTRFWLQSNNLVEDDYYIAEVSLGEGLVYSYFPVTFNPAIQGDIRIKTPWPKIIEDLITISVYKDVSQRVAKSDGSFMVELYDAENNKVAQSSVNVRGDAFFSNFKVGKYSIQVIKSADDPNQESQIWATMDTAITGEDRFISIFKKGVLAQSSQSTCNCVAFRLDDIQDFYIRTPSVDLMKLFQQKNADLTIGIIGSAFGGDPHLVDFLKRAAVNKNPTLEIASHSWNNNPLTSFDKNDQNTLLVKTNEKLLEVLGVTPKTLIAPQNAINDDILALLSELGFTHVTAHIDETHSPPYPLENLDLYYFPANTQTASLNPDGITWNILDRAVILEEVRGFLNKYGFAVVMMHPYEFSTTELGVLTGETDKQMIGEVGKLIDELRGEGIKLVTINEINEEAKRVSEQDVVKKPDVFEGTLQSCDCVAFRFAPVQDYFLNDVQIEIIDTFVRKGSPITTGIVGNLFGNDVKLVDYIKNTLEKNGQLIEIANNGWEYEDFTDLTSEEQSSLIKQSNDQILSVLDTTPAVFIPPYENFNAATISALRENNINHISSTIQKDPPPYQLSNLELYHFPSGAVTGKFNPESGVIDLIPSEETFSEVQKILDQHGFTVITLESPAFSVIENGNYVNRVDEQKIRELEFLIDMIQAQGLKIVPVGEIDLHSGGISIPSWIKNNAGWWSKDQIGDSDFVLGIQFLINEGIMRVPPSTPDSTSEITNEIPSWIKNNAGWWSQGVITDTDFVSGIQWLITNGIIKMVGT